MGYSSSGGPDGLGVVTDSNTPLSDFNAVIALIALAGQTRKGTEAIRDAIPAGQLFAGMLFTYTDKDQVDRYDGSGWVLWEKGWTAYTPTTSGFTGTVTAAYKVSMGEVTVRIRASITAMTSNPAFSLPVIASDALLEHSMGTVALIPASGSEAPGIVRRNSASQVIIYAQQVSGVNVFLNNITSTVPFASWASGVITAAFAYRAA